MKENFSKRVQSIMRYAKEEAIRLGHSYVGSEHLLLGIIKQGSGMSLKSPVRLGAPQRSLLIEYFVLPTKSVTNTYPRVYFLQLYRQ